MAPGHAGGDQIRVSGHILPIVERLPNGLVLTTADMPGARVVSFEAHVTGGHAFETPANNGVSHLLEHLHMSVTRQHPTRAELLPAIDEIAVHANAHTEPDALVFSLIAPAANLARAAQLLAALLEIRDFPAEVVHSELRVIQSELLARGWNYGPMRLLLPGHPFGLAPAGSPTSIRRLMSDVIADFDRRAFAPDELTIAVAGSMSDAERRALRETFGGLQPATSQRLIRPTPPVLKLPRFLRLRRRSRACGVSVMFFVAGPVDDTDAAALHLLDQGLTRISSPLARRLRYDLASLYEFGTHMQIVLGSALFAIHAVGQPRDRDVLVLQFLSELRKICDGRADLGWLDLTQQHFRNVMSHVLGMPEMMSHYLAASARSRRDGIPLDPLVMQRRMATLSGMSRQQFVETINRLLTRERMFVYFDGKGRLFDRARLERQALAVFG